MGIMGRGSHEFMACEPDLWVGLGDLEPWIGKSHIQAQEKDRYWSLRIGARATQGLKELGMWGWVSGPIKGAICSEIRIRPYQSSD